MTLIFIVLCLVNLFPALFWMGIYFSKDTGSKEPRRLIFETFLIGMLCTLPLFLVYYAQAYDVIPSAVGIWGSIFLFIFAFMEEMLKHAGAIHVMKIDKEARNELSDGILYAVCAALGFSFAENIFYATSQLLTTEHTEGLFQLILVRSMLTMFAHTLFSSIFGYLYALAYIAPDMRITTRTSLVVGARALFRKTKITTFAFPLLRRLFHIHVGNKLDETWEGASSMSLVAEGALIAALLHGVFNVLLGSIYSYLTFPYLFLLSFVVFWLLKKKRPV